MTTTTTTTMQPIADTKIHTRALLVWLNLRSFNGHKFDREITDKVNTEIHASANAGRYNKHLLKDSKNLKAVQSLIGAIRQEHYARTLAWSDEGWRLLTNDAYMDYTDWLRKRRNDLDRAVETFIDGYDDDLQADRVRLNGAWSRGDYPQQLDLRSRFGVSISYMPLPAEGDVRVDLASDQVAAIEADIQAKVRESIDVAVRDAWSRLHDTVAHIAERLEKPDAIFKNTLIDNARDTVAMLSKLNVMQSPELETMRARVETELTKYDAQALRDFPSTRRMVASKAAAILDTMKKNGMVA